MKVEKEADLVRYTVRILDTKGIFGWRMPIGGIIRNVGGRIIHTKNNLAGFPDFCGVTKAGRFWALELKTPKGRISIEQSEWIFELRNRKCIVAVARSFEEIDSFFEEV